MSEHPEPADEPDAREALYEVALSLLESGIDLTSRADREAHVERLAATCAALDRIAQALILLTPQKPSA